ncbi:UBA-like domain-containing protein 1 isoform X1 [Oncorhynchus nerka]|uniref:UBA-like domain-containing protein 1 isoform X1 n=1 Tax=Oncorhynchus nerka TaxID=8023 RepID=UPI001130A19E|nr:UBA-like domain-containing protein 1 isoform X1 [Oncorhynchus nerka]
MRRRPSETASTSGTLAVRDCIKCLFSRNQYSIQSPSSNDAHSSQHTSNTSQLPRRPGHVLLLMVLSFLHRCTLQPTHQQHLPTSQTPWPCSLINGSLLSPQMHTPANTPATPPNFPDALAMFSRLKASESFNASSPIASMATSPPQVNWAMGPSAPGQTQQGLWTSGQLPSQVPPRGWPQAVTQQASSEQASVTMEAER